MFMAASYGQEKAATAVKSKADIACKDLVYEGIDYSNACYVKLISICIAPIGDGETIVSYMLYNSERALLSGQSSGKTVSFSYPSVGMDINANENIIRQKLAQILNVKIADVNLK